MRYFFILFAIAGLLINPSAAEACTGITLKSKDSTTIVARTIEWGGSNLNSQYVVVPIGYKRNLSPKDLMRLGYRLDCFIFQSTVNMRNIMPQFGIKVSLICN